jgi:lysophospholipase L1-like esterase
MINLYNTSCVNGLPVMSSNWIVVVFLGDSLTAGYQQGPGYFPPRYYPFTNLLESNIRRKLRNLKHSKDLVIVNRGIDGDSTKGMLLRFQRNVAIERPHMVIIWGGINDLSTSISPDSVLQNIIRIVEETQDINAIPIVLNVTPVFGLHFNETIKELNKLIQEYCSLHNVEHLDLFSELVDKEGKQEEKYSNDGVHLSDLAYKKITNLLFITLIDIIESKKERFT